MKDFVLLIIFIFSISIYSQEKDLLKLFLDCNSCDNEYIKQNLSNVEFVRDQNFADIHLFFATQRNGSGGREYNIEFIGKKEFKEIFDEIKFSTNTDMTDDDVRIKTLKFIKLGLIRYWIKNGDAEIISLNIADSSTIEDTKEEKDPWNNWVFRIGANGRLNGQESSKSSNLNFNISAKRVTDKNKFSLRAGFSENKSTFSYEDTEIISLNNSKYIRANDVISLNGHWSVGAFASLGSSVFSNRDFYWSLKPAIEYNFFNYSESAKKQLALSYRNGIISNNYIEKTIFGKESESLWEHELTLGGSMNQIWGNIYSEVSFEQYLHDTTLNSLTFYLGTSVRLFKGFNFNASGRYSLTRNQIALPAGDVSLEELLLQQQQLQSGYNYFFNIGLSYSFGSIYNTIVNPRFNF